AIAIQQRGAGAIGIKVFALDDAYWDLRAIYCRSPLAVGLIVICVVSAGDFLFLEQGALTGGNAVLKELRGLGMRRIRETNERRIAPWGAGVAGGVKLLVKGDLLEVAAVSIDKLHHSKPCNSAAAIGQGSKIAVGVYALNAHVIAVRNQNLQVANTG